MKKGVDRCNAREGSSEGGKLSQENVKGKISKADTGPFSLLKDDEVECGELIVLDTIMYIFTSKYLYYILGVLACVVYIFCFCCKQLYLSILFAFLHETVVGIHDICEVCIDMY